MHNIPPRHKHLRCLVKLCKHVCIVVWESLLSRGGRQGSREPKTAQCGAVLLNANVWDLRLFSVRFFAAGPKVDPRVKCIMS